MYIPPVVGGYGGSENGVYRKRRKCILDIWCARVCVRERGVREGEGERVRRWPCADAGGADLATRRVEADADAGV